jgi:V/A-type H+-transporting ATPase subunit C
MDNRGFNIEYALLFEDWVWANDPRYAYATGLIRSFELRLISPERFLQLTEARTVDEVFSMLGDTDYTRAYQDDIGGVDRYEVEYILRDEEERVKGIVDELTQDKEVTDLLFMRYDFFNIKLALKELYRGREPGDAYSPLGLLSPLVIQQEVRSVEETSELPPPLFDVIGAAKAAYEAEENPADIDAAVDAIMYRFLTDAIREKRLLFFYKLLTMEVDTINILTFFRTRWQDAPQDVFRRAFIEGGGLPLEYFGELYTREMEGIETAFGNTEYRDLVGDGVPYLKGEGTFLRLETLVDNEFLRLLRRTKLINYGIEILLAYYYAKAIEIKKLRTIIRGKENELSPEEIKLRIGHV